MKERCILLLLVFLMICPPHLVLPLASAEEEIDLVELTRGTPVVLRVTEMFSSEISHLGDLVHMEVIRDVLAGGKVVISAGTPAEGDLIIAEDKGFIGEPGKIGLAVKTTTTVDGQTVYLRATLHREGKDKQMASLLLGLGICFFFLFMKGTEAEINPGVEIKAYVDNDIAVKV